MFALSRDYPKTAAELRRPLAEAQGQFQRSGTEVAGRQQRMERLRPGHRRLREGGPGSRPARRDRLAQPGRWQHPLVPRAVDGLRRRARPRVRARAHQRAVDRCSPRSMPSGAAPARMHDLGRRAAERRRSPVRNVVGRLVQPCGAATLGEGWPASGEPATYKDEQGTSAARGACRSRRARSS